MANSSVVQETLTGSPATPEPSLPAETLDAKIDRRLSAVSPELEEQTNIETKILDNWVAFKVAPHIVEKIYAGEDLSINLVQMRDEVILPEYRARQAEYLSESVSIVSRQLPGLKARLQQSKDSLASTDELLAIAEERNMPTQLSLRQTQSRTRKDIKSLTSDIENASLLAKTKDAMFAKINDFLKHSSADEVDSKVDRITYVAKKIALHQVASSFETDLSMLDRDDPAYELAAEALRTKITALRNELHAIEEAESRANENDEMLPFEATVFGAFAEEDEQPPLTTEVIVPHQEKHGRQVRLLGGFTTALAAFMK